MCLLYGIAGCQLCRGCLTIEVNGRKVRRDGERERGRGGKGGEHEREGEGDFGTVTDQPH